jgi:curved DNA-binding protein CbpA
VRAQALRTLGLAPGASLDEINQAFRKAAMKHHPDKHPPARRAQAEARYKKISEAYEFLKRHGAGKAAA